MFSACGDSMFFALLSLFAEFCRDWNICHKSNGVFPTATIFTVGNERGNELVSLGVVSFLANYKAYC